MFMHRLPLLSLGLAAALAAAPAGAETCKADVAWKHRHEDASPDTQITDVQGTRATRIEVCRDAGSGGEALKVEVQFAGSHSSQALAAGSCDGRYTKWALVRSIGAAGAQGPSEVGGVYRICKE